MTAMQSLIEQFSNTEVKIVKIGSFQPYELVRVHHNPTDLILTNEHDHTVAGTAVVLLDDDQERTGLTFKPNISNISQRNESVKLILASTTAQSISVEYESYPAKQFDLEANKPVVVIIGEMFGIPMLESTANFFDIAVGGGNQPVNGLTLKNAILKNGGLTYTGGTIDFDWPYNGSAAFSLTKPLAENEEFSFELPNYDIGGENLFEGIYLFVSSSDTVLHAFNTRPMLPTPPASPTVVLWDFTENGANSGLSIISPESSGYERTDLILKTLVKSEVKVLANSVSIETTDKQTSEVTTHEVQVPGLMSTPKYLHVLVIVNSENLPSDLSLIELPLVVYDEQDAGSL